MLHAGNAIHSTAPKHIGKIVNSLRLECSNPKATTIHMHIKYAHITKAEFILNIIIVLFN